MPRFMSRLAAICAMIACGCLACAFIFGSGNREAKRDRDTQEILTLFDEAATAEQEGDATKALGLYAKAQDKTYAFDKAHPREDPTTMRLIRTRCTIQIENIRFNLAKQSNESPIAVTPSEPDGTAPAVTQPGIVISSRLVDGTARPRLPQPAEGTPRPTPPQSVEMSVTLERVIPVVHGDALSIHDQVEWARDLMELGRPEKALEYLRAVLSADPDHIGARFLFALASLQCGDDAAAETFLTDLEHDAPSEAVHLLLGAVHFQRENFNAALAAVRKARELNPKSAAACLNEALILLEIPGTPRGLAVTAYRQALLLGAARDPALEARLNQP